MKAPQEWAAVSPSIASISHHGAPAPVEGGAHHLDGGRSPLTRQRRTQGRRRRRSSSGLEVEWPALMTSLGPIGQPAIRSMA